METRLAELSTSAFYSITSRIMLSARVLGPNSTLRSPDLNTVTAHQGPRRSARGSPSEDLAEWKEPPLVWRPLLREVGRAGRVAGPPTGAELVAISVPHRHVDSNTATCVEVSRS